MRYRMFNFCTLLLALMVGHRSLGAETYVAYSRDGIQVVAAGGDRAIAIANHLARFDKALTGALGLSDNVTPIILYELSSEDSLQVLSSRGTAYFSFSGFDTTVVTDRDADSNNSDWGALFGYTGGLIVTGRALRCPRWYLQGVPQVFAQARFESGRVLVGGVIGGYVQLVRNTGLIPSQVFLNLRADDPQFSDPNFQSRFAAQSWYLAYQIFVQGLLRSEFQQYLKLIRQGTSENDAFVQSFKFSHEELDKRLMQAMHDPAHVYIVKVPSEEGNRGSVEVLSAAEVRARFADLNLKEKRTAESLRLAAEALRIDPRNELAMRVTARAYARDKNVDATLASLNKLQALPASSAGAHADMGKLWFDLAEGSHEQGSAVPSIDAMNQSALVSFEHSVSVDPEHLPAWVGLSRLYGRTRDTKAAIAFIEKATPVMQSHPSNSELASALADMAARTGQTSSALLFGEYWRTNAITQQDFVRANAFLDRVKAGH